MSQETSRHLNTQTLIGYTAKRGNAWHYRAEDQGAESNHYVGAIPVEDVHRRLFNWEPVEAELTATALTDTGVLTVTDPTRKVIVRPDTNTVLGVFKQGYRVHTYQEWLLDNVESILDADLQIGSAGLLKGGAVAWVQVEMAETLNVAGVEFRPFLTATTSLDGSLASTYMTGAQLVVCDNTLSAALSERSTMIKIKHSAKSLGKIGSVRDALGIVYATADAFSAQVEELTAQVVTDETWAKFVTAYTGSESNGKADQLNLLYNKDERVTPWRGTAFGVLQAANTWAHHSGVVRGASRAERNMQRVVRGQVDDLDANTMKVLASVS